MSNSATQRFIDADGKSVELVLFMYATCPYCQRVLHRAAALGLDLPQRNIHQDPKAYQELQRVGGKTTVPCLFINGRPLYESADIITYLEKVSPA